MRIPSIDELMNHISDSRSKESMNENIERLWISCFMN